MKTCPRCLFDESIAAIGETQCEYCDIHDRLESQADPQKLDKQIQKIRDVKGKYNCLMGISGGLDSSTLLYMAVKWWGLKPLVIHFDNNYNTPEAKENMRNLVTKLGVDCITYQVNHVEYQDLNHAFRYAGTPDGDIPNDVAMTKLMYDTARMYSIKYILNGHCFRTEGSTPREWTYMDAMYIKSVYKWRFGKELQNFPLFTFKDQIWYSFLGIKQIRPFHYMQNREVCEEQMKKFIGWKEYGAKHCENEYTAFVGYHLLPNKFGIDKRRVYLSAKMRCGEITREQAHELLAMPVPTTKKWSYDETIRERTYFKRYNFKKYRPLIWLLMKLKVVPYTFYIKYCFDKQN